MSGLFKTPSAPGPDPELKAAQARQEEALAAEDRKKRLQIAARMNARKVGGQRVLLSKTREDAEQGIQETLGA